MSHLASMLADMNNERQAARRERAREMRRAGASRSTIVRELKMRNGTVLTSWIADLPRPRGLLRARAKDEFREIAIAMRKEGKSYREIRAVVPVSKGTLSLWLRDVPMTEEHRERLIALRKDPYGRRAATLKARRVSEESRAMSASRGQIGDISSRELFLMGVVAYWAEGAKAKPWRHQSKVSFINSDRGMITLFLEWLRTIGVEADRLKFRLAIHESADVDAATRYWAEVVGVPPDLFMRPTLKRHNPKTVRHNVGEHYRGCLIIEVRRPTELYRQISGWFDGIMSSIGGSANGKPPGFGPGNRGPIPLPPAVHQATLFEAPISLVKGAR